MGSNITSTPTSEIQSNLGIKSDNDYGAQTTAAVKAFQTSNGLVSDGIFGPKTLAAYNTKFPASNLITTSGSAQSQFTQNSSELSKAEQALGITGVPASSTPNDTSSGGSGSDAPAADTTTTDPVLSGLDSLKTANDNATNSLISTTQSSYDSQVNNLDKEFQSYKGGLQLLGIQSGQSEATPDLLLGHIHQAVLDQMDKVNALKSEEAKTIMDAKTAQANNDFKTLQDKTARLKEIQDEKSKAIQDVNTIVTGQSKTAAIEAHDVYDTLQTLDDDDKEQFIQAVAQKFGLPVNSLVTALTDEQANRSTTDLKTTNTQSIIDKREAPPKPKTESPTAIKKEQIDQGLNVLQTGKLPDGTKIGNPKGADGFYDPGVYTQAFNEWKGTPKAFVTNYGLVGSINPLSYTKLPAALQSLLPKTKTTSGRSS